MSEMNIATITPVITNKVKASLDFNYDEIKSTIEKEIGHFNKEVVTENTVGDAKKICAGLKKLDKKLNRSRIDEPKVLLEKIEPFQNQMKELSSYVMEKHDHLNSQIEKFIEEARVQKKANVELIKTQTQEEIELKPEYLERVELKDKYMNSSESLNKVKADMVQQFQTLKLEQDLEQQKIDTVDTIIEAYNDSLEFKFNASNFSHLMNEDVATISATVKKMVLQRKEDEKAKKEQIEKDKQEAIKKAKEDAEHESKLEALRVEGKRIAAEQHKEKEHQDELKRIARENELKEQKIREESQAEAVRMTETIVESVDKYVPVEAKEEDEVNDYMLEIKATEQQLEAIKIYLDAGGIKLVHVEVL